jgi:hypothetical protein
MEKTMLKITNSNPTFGEAGPFVQKIISEGGRFFALSRPYYGDGLVLKQNKFELIRTDVEIKEGDVLTCRLGGTHWIFRDGVKIGEVKYADVACRAIPVDRPTTSSKD